MSLSPPCYGGASEFSLVRGGPLYRVWRRIGLADESLGAWQARVLVTVIVSWIPLLLLSLAEGRAWAGDVALPFWLDAEMHVRLLIVVPLLLLAEVVAHRRMQLTTQYFLERGLIPPDKRAQFDAAVASAMRLRDSVAAEGALALAAYGIGVLYVWRTQVALDVASWYALPTGGQLVPTLAGWWLAVVSLPIFQFLLVRWYYRLFIWARFLWQVSRIPLRLLPTHPDRCGGLGFLGFVRLSFAPLLIAQGAMLAGMIADRILFAGAQLPQFKVELIALTAFMVSVVLGPLLAFSGQMEAAEGTGQREYGRLAQDYAREFDHKWLRGGARPGEALVGSADIQSLADIGSSFEVVQGMSWAPFRWQTVLQLSATTLLPVLPLTLTMFSLEELADRALTLVF